LVGPAFTNDAWRRTTPPSGLYVLTTYIICT
jgi:hypothetical protein